MIITKEQRESFEKSCEPLMSWLLLNTHPHCTAIVDSHRAELVDGVATIVRKDDDQ